MVRSQILASLDSKATKVFADTWGTGDAESTPEAPTIRAEARGGAPGGDSDDVSGGGGDTIGKLDPGQVRSSAATGARLRSFDPLTAQR